MLGLTAALNVAGPAVGQAPDLSPDSYRVSVPVVDEARKEMTGPRVPDLDDGEAAGLSKGSKPASLTWERAYTLALVRSRGEGQALAARLDADELDKEAGRLGVADFARFRKDFLEGRNFRDPSADLLDLQRRLQVIGNARRQVATQENLANLLRRLIQGESSSVTQFDLDRVGGAVLKSRRVLSHEVGQYRDRLDALKVELGLSPGAPVILDMRSLAAFHDLFAETDNWFRMADRRLQDLPEFGLRLPTPGLVEYQRRPILSEIARDPDSLEAVLLSASRAAVTHREGREQDRAEGVSDVELELRVRRRIRHLVETRETYEAERSNVVLTLRQKDNAFERLIAPPAVETAPAGNTLVVVDLLTREDEIRDNRNRLVSLWTTFQAERLAFYRDLGALPFGDWKSFYDQFQAVAGVRPPAAPDGERPPPPAPPRPPQVPGRPSAVRPAGR